MNWSVGRGVVGFVIGSVLFGGVAFGSMRFIHMPVEFKVTHVCSGGFASLGLHHVGAVVDDEHER